MAKNILLLGSGGREHALAWKIAQSPKVDKLFIAPGNAGTKEVGENVNIKVTDFDAIADFVLANGVSMVVVGPEDPLVKGIYDGALPLLNAHYRVVNLDRDVTLNLTLTTKTPALFNLFTCKLSLL